MKRKDLKRNARKAVKKHYLMFLILCVTLGMLGLNYSESLSTVKSVITGESTVEDLEEEIEHPEESYSLEEDLYADEEKEESPFDKVFDLISMGDFDGSRSAAELSSKEMTTSQRKLGVVSIQHSRGFLSKFVNMTASGSILVVITDALRSITQSNTGAIIIFVLLSAVFVFFIRVFVFNVIRVSITRYFLESRMYAHVPTSRLLLFVQIKKWANVALGLLLETIYQILWGFTVIGGIIKGYSYFMVPYILAENPSVKPKQAITLSRKMMNGHKFECFLLKLSFIGWSLLDFLTFGLSGIFYSNPYEEATMAEYYAYIRGLAIENQIPGYEAFNDRYLFEKADEALIANTYADMLSREPVPEVTYKDAGLFTRIFTGVFGICLSYNEKAKAYERYIVYKEFRESYKYIVNQEQYPGRLFVIPKKEKSLRIESVNYLRHYSVPSLILMFFIFCFIGWSWEVSLHLITEARFVNRGIMHGPWLPIYGFGGVFILVILNKFRNKPALQFILAVVLAGSVEYFTSWYLEMAYNGQKWWDYSGYFLNLNGRICAEGLLVFGLGGVAIVYLLAPALDNQLRKIPLKKAIILCSVLIVIYGCDQVYSHYHPNAGDGISTVYHQEGVQNYKC